MSEIILARADDPRLFCVSHPETSVSYEHDLIEADAPIYLVIGRQAPEEAIRLGCDRFGLDPEVTLRAVEGLPA